MRKNAYVPQSQSSMQESIIPVLSLTAEKIHLILTQELLALAFSVKREVLMSLIFGGKKVVKYRV